MANNQEVREALVLAYGAGVVDKVEFALLNDLNKPNNLQIPYWQYDPFNLDLLSHDECWAEFRFKKNGILIITYNKHKVDPVEGLCILLKRLAYPCRYCDLVPRFARPVPELCVITAGVLLMEHMSFALF